MGHKCNRKVKQESKGSKKEERKSRKQTTLVEDKNCNAVKVNDAQPVSGEKRMAHVNKAAKVTPSKKCCKHTAKIEVTPTKSTPTKGGDKKCIKTLGTKDEVQTTPTKSSVKVVTREMEKKQVSEVKRAVAKQYFEGMAEYRFDGGAVSTLTLKLTHYS
mgnify:CR=1 FL=1